MEDEGRTSSERGLGWLLAHPGWSGIGGLIAVAGLVISIWPQSGAPAETLPPSTSMVVNTTTAPVIAPPSTTAPSTAATTTTTTTVPDDPLAVLDVGIRPSIFDERLGQRTRVAPITDEVGDAVSGFDLVTWSRGELVVEAVVDTDEGVVRGYTVTPLSRDLAPTVPHLPDTSQIVLGQSSFGDMIVPVSGRQGGNPPNGRFHYAEAFDGGTNTDYRVVVLIASHASPVELINRSTSEAFDAFFALNGECLGFGLTEVTCEGHPLLDTVRSGMVVTAYAVADPGFENFLALFPENL